MGSRKQSLTKELSLNEKIDTTKKKPQDESDNEKAKKKEKAPKIIVRAESESDSNNEITIELKAILDPMKTCCWKIGDHPYLIIERALNKPEDWLTEDGKELDPNKIDPGADTCSIGVDLIPVVKLDHMHYNAQPEFKEFKKKIQVFTGPDKNALLKFSIKRYDENGIHKPYGYFLSNVDQIMKQRD